EPKRTSILTGERWLRELLAGNDDRFSEQFGMGKETFRILLKELSAIYGFKRSRYVSAEERLAIIL
ncbi:hypothetical protein BDZ89DRAFT_908856, partial [Hymenopellis radicata]